MSNCCNWVSKIQEPIRYRYYTFAIFLLNLLKIKRFLSQSLEEIIFRHSCSISSLTVPKIHRSHLKLISICIRLQESDHSCGWSWQSGKNILHQRHAKRYACGFTKGSTSSVYFRNTTSNHLCFPPSVANVVESGSTHGCIRHELRVENYLVTLLDVGGSAESRGTWRELYGEAHGIIFVVDSGDRQRIKAVREVLSDLLKQPRVAGKPLLV